MPIGKKVRIYDLARELKQDTKRVIEDLKREGADVDVPSNSVSVEIAEKVRNKYFPKMETAPKRAIKIIKAAKKEETSALMEDEITAPVQVEEPIEETIIEPHEDIIEPQEQTFEAPILKEEKTTSTGVHKLLKKRVVAEPAKQPQPEIPVVEEAPALSVEEITVAPVELKTEQQPEAVADVVEGASIESPAVTETESPLVEAPPAVNAPRVFRPTGTSVKQLTLTKDALQKGIKPGERVVSEAQAKTGKLDPNKPADKSTARRDDRKGGARRTDLRGTPGESAQPQMTYTPPSDNRRKPGRSSGKKPGGRPFGDRGGRFNEPEVDQPRFPFD
jgi:translation initiation factor IF-2